MNITETSEHTDSQKTKNSFPELVTLINNALLDKKGENLTVLDVRQLTTLTDYFILCTGGSDTQIKALAYHVIETVKEQLGENAWQKEGLNNKRWVVLDYINVVVHIFNEETRRFYALETMWNDAEVTTIQD
ncbi:ribosome silencing factor [Balneolaceae bacterium ANBcel3]|nr:ribosome silencing factor [Balneolaceae bacterium ANBcel3]